MVFFTCNKCGESVKKPAVEKHYNFKCRKPVCVSCMDCLKDFHGEEYAKHTTCITEAEKYSGKDYVSKESKNSGQKKQESWLEIVRSILDTKEFSMSPVVRGIFQRLQGFDNVPRKKVKFEKFVSNSMRINAKQSGEVWAVLEKALDVFKNSSQQQTTNGVQQNQNNNEKQSNGTNNESEENLNIKPSNDPEKLEDSTNKKKKKKRKHDEVAKDTNIPEPEAESLQNKKSKVNGENISNGISNGFHSNGIQNKTQKKNNKRKESNEIKENNGNLGEDSSKNENTMEVENSVGERKFNWSESMVNILNKKNGEMKLGKLKKKLTKKYKSFHGLEELTPKFEKTFNKMLKKSKLLVENDLVKIDVNA